MVAILFSSLTPSEQDEAFEIINRQRLQRIAGDESDSARTIRSLMRVAEIVGRSPTITDYRREQPALTQAGEDIATANEVLRHFVSWHRVTEALELAEVETTRRIQARFP